MRRKSLSLVQYSPHPLFAPRTQGDYRTTFAVAWSAELAHLLCREALRGEPETHPLTAPSGTSSNFSTPRQPWTLLNLREPSTTYSTTTPTSSTFLGTPDSAPSRSFQNIPRQSPPGTSWNFLEPSTPPPSISPWNVPEAL